MQWDQYGKTMAAAFADTCRKTPQKTALVFNDQALTWAQLDEQTDKLAAYLLSVGIARGDRVGIMCTVRPEYVLAYLACARIGAVLVGFNAGFKAAEVQKLVARTQPKAFFLLRHDRERCLFDEISPVLAEATGIADVVPIEAGAEIAGGRFGEILQPPLADTARSAVRAAENAVQEDDGLLIVFTSGSTGVPKAAVLTHKNVIRNIAVQIRHFQMVEDDKVLLHLPLNHVAGANEQLASTIMLGATAIMLERFHPKATLEIIERHKVSFVMQVPTMYIMEFGVENFASYDLSSLRILCVAGAVTPPEIMKKMMEIAPTVVTGYGMTEVGGFASYTAPGDEADTISFTVGAIAPEFRLQIVNEKRETLAVREIGEIALGGDCVFKEYFGDPAATGEAVADGWYYTGDMGYLDERGYVTLVDRKKMMYITGGYNVYPREIEDAVAAMPGVDMCACVSRKDATFGEIGVLFVTPKSGQQLTVEAVMAHCRNVLADYKVPRHVVIYEVMPFTALGKIDKQVLIGRARELDGELATA